MTRLDEIRRLRIVRSSWVLLALFSVRAVVPVGYMPAPLSEGGPFALCHGSSADTIALLGSVDTIHNGAAGMHGADASHPKQAGEPAGGHDESWENCPLGIGAADAAVAFVNSSLAIDASTPLIHTYGVTPSLSSYFVRYRARAPPV